MESFTRKIGTNRGKPRLWIEGKHLIAAGLDHGKRWDLVPFENDETGEKGFMIAGDADGTRKIAGKPGRPIVDINGVAPLGHCADAETVTITYEQGSQCLRVVKG